MADIKWSSFPSTAAAAASGDTLVGLHSGANYQFNISATPVALAMTQWDSNKNLNANSMINAYTTTATAAGNTVLTAGSTYYQYFTGTTTQTVTMPDVTTLAQGQTFYIVNNSTGLVTVNSSGGNAIQIMAADSSLLVTCILTTGTTAASWNATYIADTGGTVNTGTANQLAYYATTGQAVSGLTTAANGILVTNVSGVPSIGNSVGADLTINSVRVGRGNSAVATNTVVGSGAGSSFSSGNHNTAMGWSSLDGVTTGANNVAYGYSTGISGASGAVTLQTGSANVFVGYRASSTLSSAAGVIAIGADAVAPAATGITDNDNGPSIAFGSDLYRVGFRGDGTIYTGGSGRGYWRVIINGTAYYLPCFIEGTTTANAVMITDPNGSPTLTTEMTDGQLVIGVTGNRPFANTLTAGTGVSITNAPGNITINSTGGGLTWSEVTGTSQAMAVNNGYIANNAALVTLTLPATAAIGEKVIVQGKGLGLFRIAQNSGQIIHFNSLTSTLGVTGYAEATQRYNTVELICITANNEWALIGNGNITIA